MIAPKGLVPRDPQREETCLVFYCTTGRRRSVEKARLPEPCRRSSLRWNHDFHRPPSRARTRTRSTDGVLLDAAVAAGVVEANDLDWKSELPPAKGLPQTDFPKDVAAMANSGGVIVFGVRESQKAAVERVDVGELDEAYERSLRSAAITAISPPVFGLNVHRLGTAGSRAVIVEVPASLDGPHLIYKTTTSPLRCATTQTRCG